MPSSREKSAAVTPWSRPAPALRVPPLLHHLHAYGYLHREHRADSAGLWADQHPHGPRDVHHHAVTGRSPSLMRGAQALKPASTPRRSAVPTRVRATPSGGACRREWAGPRSSRSQSPPSRCCGHRVELAGHELAAFQLAVRFAVVLVLRAQARGAGVRMHPYGAHRSVRDCPPVACTMAPDGVSPHGLKPCIASQSPRGLSADVCPPQRSLLCVIARVRERQLQDGEIRATYVADGSGW